MFRVAILTLSVLLLFSGCTKLDAPPTATPTSYIATLSGDGSQILTLDFGDVTTIGNSAERSVTITNATDEDYTNVQVTLPNNHFQFKDGTFPGTGGNCSTTISAHSSCNVIVMYKANAVISAGILSYFFVDGPAVEEIIEVPLMIRFLHRGAIKFNIVLLKVRGINHKPKAFNQSIAVDEDTSTAILLEAADQDGDALSYTLLTQPSHGALSGAAPMLQYSPQSNYNGVDTFTFKVNDGKHDSEIATVSINVGSANDAPIANSQNLTTNEDTALSITLTGSDTENSPLSYILFNSPSHGTLTGSGASRTYTPAKDYNGQDSFTFKTNDGELDSALATVSITVTSVNDGPIANDQSVTTNEDTAKQITLSGSDPEGSALTYTIVSNPSHGTLSGSGTNRTYTPTKDYNGQDSFTFKVNDGQLDSALATVSITVTSVNDGPIANDQSVTTNEDTAKQITLSGSDLEGSALTYTIVSNPSHGTLSGSGTNRTYTPTKDYNGQDSFTFKANDGELDSALATVSITVTSVNDVPIANDQSVTTNEDTTKQIVLSGTDIENSPLAYVIVSPPLHGTLSGSGANKTYTPAKDYNGQDSFTFKVNDGQLDSAVVTVSITVTPVNDAPIANNQSVNATQFSSSIITITGSDPEGDTLTYLMQSNPSHGTLTGTAPNLTYTPDNSYIGSDSFTFKVNDGKLDSSLATVSITVNATPITSQDIALLSNPYDTFTQSLKCSTTSSGSLSYMLIGKSSGGTVSLVDASSGKFQFAPTQNTQPISFSYRCTEGVYSSKISSVTITFDKNTCPPTPYGNNGVNTYTSSSSFLFDQLTGLQEGGKVIAGIKIPKSGSNYSYGFVRLDCHGDLDMTFGTQGILDLNPYWGSIFPSQAQVKVGKDNNIYLLGRTTAQIFKFNKNGVQDESFGTNGVADLNSALNGANGSYSGYAPAVLVLRSNDTFSMLGYVTKSTYTSSGYTMERRGFHAVISADGKQLLNLELGTTEMSSYQTFNIKAGIESNDGQVYVGGDYHYNTSGALDVFALAKTSDFSPYSIGRIYSDRNMKMAKMLKQKSGNLILFGKQTTLGNSNFWPAMVIYKSPITINASQRVLYDDWSDEARRDLVIFSNDKMLGIGDKYLYSHGNESYTPRNIYLEKFNADGIREGIITLPDTAGYFAVNSVVQADDKVVILTKTEQSFGGGVYRLIRINSNGQLDISGN